MILLITPYAGVQHQVPAWEAALARPIRTATSLRQAIARLRSADYFLVAIDESLLETEPEESDLLLQHIGTAIPVYLNFAISGPERVLRKLRSALHRRIREDVLARQAAERSLQSELKGSITAALLSCDLALEVPGLPRAAEERIRAVASGIRELRARIGLKEPKEQKTAGVKSTEPTSLKVREARTAS